MSAKQYDLWIRCNRKSCQIRDVCRLCAIDYTASMQKFARKTTMADEEKKKTNEWLDVAVLSAQDKQKSLWN